MIGIPKQYRVPEEGYVELTFATSPDDPRRWFGCDAEAAFSTWQRSGGTWEGFMALGWRERCRRKQIECDARRARGEPDPEAE